MILLLVIVQFVVTGADVLHPSCVFNPLCTCSRSDANLGVVTCSNVPLFKIPNYITRSKINSFQLENNDLLSLEPHFLAGTGLHVLKITRNAIHTIHPESLKGLESSLRELELSYLELVEVPRAALANLQRLQILNLAGNEISDVSQQNWVNVRNYLETLTLRENSISYVPANAFERFSKLKVLDLSKNVILDLNPDVFFPDTTKLTHLYLSDNQLRFIPYAQLQQLRSLKTLDLSFNFINKINALSEATRTQINSKFQLTSLNLKYNDIRSLSSEDFEKFSSLNATYFDGNPITMIQIDTFQNIRISELSFSECGLVTFNAGMIKGLERSLITLDLSNNFLAALDTNLFGHFSTLQELKLLGNNVEYFAVPDYNNNIFALEISGNEGTNFQALLIDVGRIKSLIRIFISDVEIPYITANYFLGYGFGVEELSIKNAYLKTIYDQTFIHVRGLKKLDLSNNELVNIHEHAFAEIGHSLIHLNLANAFSSLVKTFPNIPMAYLYSVRIFDISHNHFEELPYNTFIAMKDLEVVRAHDCQIKALRREMFQSEIHSNLKEVTFSYNMVKVLKSYIFTDLPELTYLNVEDNQLETIETHAFNNLKKLRWIYLRGNQIDEIQSDAFSNLPELELLDLAFNNLKNFDVSCLDQMVGSLTFLTLNLTYNYMYSLQVWSSESDFHDLNIKIMDLSHNNISDISEDYFNPMEYSLTHLYLQYNYLTNISKNVFGDLFQLQWLDLSHNRIRFIEHDIFKEINKIQVLNFLSNDLHDIPANLFYAMKGLRILDLSENKLNFIPDFSFREDSLESVNLGRNRFVKIPYKSFSPEVAKSLRKLDISENELSAIHTSELISQFRSLEFLNVSGNKINRVEEALFSRLNNLLYLDLSNNIDLRVAENGRSFTGIQDNLIYLGMNNISLTTVPDLSFPKLVYLHLSNNTISEITPEAVMNLTSVRVLNLSYNKFNTLPVVLLSMKNLRHLNISGNIIPAFTNNSLLNGFVELSELDITRLPLTTFETGALSRLISMRTLHVNTYEDVDNFNLPKILEKNFALQHLHVVANVKHLNSEMRGAFSKKLRKVTITGDILASVDDKILLGLSHPTLDLTIEGTEIESLNENFFKSIFRVRNITVDVRHNYLKEMVNPSTATKPNLFNHTFLLGVLISQNPWRCKCDIGWIETWQRTSRQILCNNILFSATKSSHGCMMIADDLRKTFCANQKPLLQVTKTELECGWSRGSCNFQIKVQYVPLFLLIWRFYYN